MKFFFEKVKFGEKKTVEDEKKNHKKKLPNIYRNKKKHNMLLHVI